MYEVRTALGRILTGRVVFLIDGLELATTQDPWFVQELLGGLGDQRVLWVCAGQPITSVGRALKYVAPVMVFPWEEEEIPWPETPNGGPVVPPSAESTARWVTQMTQFGYYMNKLGNGFTWPWDVQPAARLTNPTPTSRPILGQPKGTVAVGSPLNTTAPVLAPTRSPAGRVMG